jgi:hypothetical protein
VLDGLSPLAYAWSYRAAVFVHIAAVVVWFGAVAYYLLILRPALRRSGVERKAQYAILAEIRARLKRVVGVAVLVLVASGITLARLKACSAAACGSIPFASGSFISSSPSPRYSCSSSSPRSHCFAVSGRRSCAGGCSLRHTSSCSPSARSPPRSASCWHAENHCTALRSPGDQSIIRA